MSKPLIIIAGPTACGKTDISIKLAKELNGEIISADSMQVYKFMDIGTAKASYDEMQGIRHYLIDELYPDEEFNVMIFQQKAKEYIKEIYSKGKLPIVAGGTGFYINALVNDNNFMETCNDNSIREKLYADAEEKGNEYIYSILREVDPEYAASVHPNNVKRVARALEFYYLTGKKLSEHNAEEKDRLSPYNVSFIIINMDREKLYERIDKRVDIMIENGLTDEVRRLLDMGYSPELVSMQGLGYKEIVPYIKGETTLDEAVYELKKRTRHFAKRQLTWFKRQTNGFWVDVTDITTEEAVNKIKNYILENNKNTEI